MNYCDFCGDRNAKMHLTYHHGVLSLCDPCWEAYAGVASLPEKERFIHGLLAHQIQHGGVLRLCDEECQALYAMLPLPSIPLIVSRQRKQTQSLQSGELYRPVAPGREIVPYKEAIPNAKEGEMIFCKHCGMLLGKGSHIYCPYCVGYCPECGVMTVRNRLCSDCIEENPAYAQWEFGVVDFRKDRPSVETREEGEGQYTKLGSHEPGLLSRFFGWMRKRES